MSTEHIEQIADYSQEPKWLEISWKYTELYKTTKQLSEDIRRYQDAIADLDGAGTSIANAKDRIFILKEAIAALEAAK